jgi:hypothetical protein
MARIHELDELLAEFKKESFPVTPFVEVTGLGSIVWTDRPGKLVLCPYLKKRFVPERPSEAPELGAEVEPTLTGMDHLRDFLARGESYRTSSDRSVLASALRACREVDMEPQMARKFADRLVRDGLLARRGIRVRSDSDLPCLDTSTESLAAFSEENRGSGLDPIEAAVRQTLKSNRNHSLIESRL